MLVKLPTNDVGSYFVNYLTLLFVIFVYVQWVIYHIMPSNFGYIVKLNQLPTILLCSFFFFALLCLVFFLGGGGVVVFWGGFFGGGGSLYHFRIFYGRDGQNLIKHLKEILLIAFSGLSFPNFICLLDMHSSH